MLMIQISVTIKEQDYLASELSNIEKCVSEIKVWMECNILKLTDIKTEFIVFKSRCNCQDIYRTEIGDTEVHIRKLEYTYYIYILHI